MFCLCAVSVVDPFVFDVYFGVVGQFSTFFEVIFYGFIFEIKTMNNTPL